MKFLLIVLLLAGCTSTGNWNFAGFSMFNKDSQITNEVEVDQELFRMEGQRKMTEEEKKTLQNGIQKGMKLYREKKKSSFFSQNKLRYANYDYKEESHSRMVENFLGKNRKAKGIHRDLMLVAAVAYDTFSDWTVVEGLRTKEKQAEYVRKGVSKTMNSKHLVGRAIDVYAKNRKGRFSSHAIDRLGMARGVMYAVYLDLRKEGFICLEWEHVTLWSFRDAFHIQLNIPKDRDCKNRV